MDSRTKRSWIIRREYRNKHCLPRMNIRRHLTNPALRWLRLRKRIPLQTDRLQHRHVAPKLRRFDRRSLRFSHRLRTVRRYQDANTEPQLRQSQVRIQDCKQHDEERGHYQLL